MEHQHSHNVHSLELLSPNALPRNRHKLKPPKSQSAILRGSLWLWSQRFPYCDCRSVENGEPKNCVLWRMAHCNIKSLCYTSGTCHNFTVIPGLLLFILWSLPLAWIRNHIHFEMWNEITYRFHSFNSSRCSFGMDKQWHRTFSGHAAVYPYCGSYGSVLVAWCAKNRHILTAPEHLLTAPDDF